MKTWRAPILALGIIGAAAAQSATAACDVTLSHALSNNQIVLKVVCSGDVTGINWLRDGATSLGAVDLSAAPLVAGVPAYTTTPMLSGTHQYTATGATGVHPATTVDIAAGTPAVITTPQPVLTVAPTGGGSVASAPAGITVCTSANPAGCTAGFNSGATVSLTAAADSGYAFAGWSGDCTGSATVCAVNMSGPKTVSANFGPQPVTGVCATSTTPVTTAPSGTQACTTGSINGSVTDPGVVAQGNFTWTCSGINGGAASGQCSVPKKVDGACGSKNGATNQTIAPSGTDACSAGSVTGMTTGASTFTWACNGFNNGTNVTNCSATIAQTPGACGSANGGNTLSAPTGTAACSTGTINGSVSNPATAGGDYTWTCLGLAGGQSSSQCTAHQTVNGACGSASGGSFSSAPTSNLCVAGSTPTATPSGTGPWSWGCNGVNGGTSTSATACSAVVTQTGSCGTTPAAYTVVHSGDSIYGGTWRPDLSSATYVAQLPVGAGVALELPAMTNVYPYGFKVTDSTGGAKNYVISKCPGSTVPVNGQDGTISVNGDSRLDSCKGQGGYVRWIDTSGATASYYNSVYLSFQTTCFLPTTTSQGSGAAATYYINIMNTGSGAVGVQYSNQSQLN